jgi:hypothetical protein
MLHFHQEDIKEYGAKMLHYKTFYLGCDNTGDVATVENNCVRINRRFNMAHRPLMGILCYHFFHAQLMQQEGLLDGPYKLSLICRTGRLKQKIKEHNKFTVEDTFNFFLNGMLPPEKGIIVSIYETDLIKNYIAPYEDMRCITPMKEEYQWVGDGDYITFQEIESCLSRPAMRNHKNNLITKDIDNISIYPVKRITYAMGEEEMFSLMKHAKFHIAYPGGTYYSAYMINCPTIGVYHNKKITDGFHETMHEVVSTFIRQYGYLGYDIQNKKADSLRQNYLKHVTNDELVCYLKGYADYK